jgi:hypothetical protein
MGGIPWRSVRRHLAIPERELTYFRAVYFAYGARRPTPCPFDEALELIEALLPEGLGSEVDAEGLGQVVGRVASAGLEEANELGHEGLAFLLIHVVDGEDKELPEDIGVAVEAGLDEV